MKWKEVHNLTTIDDPKKIFLYHYVDSILGLKELEKYPTSPSYYDLGSGAGFPGLIAAVLWPEKDIFLVETSKKKSSFLRLSASAMGLNRVKVLDQRVEALRDIPFAITRAAFSPENWPLLEPALAPDGRIAFWLSDNISLEGYKVAEIVSSPVIADVRSTRVGLGEAGLILSTAPNVKSNHPSPDFGKPKSPSPSRGEGSKTLALPVGEGIKCNWALDYQSYYELEPGHRRQIAVFVSRGTSSKGKEAK